MVYYEHCIRQTVVISGAGHLLTFHLLSCNISDTKDPHGLTTFPNTKKRRFKNATSSGVFLANFETFEILSDTVLSAVGISSQSNLN